MLKKRGWDAVAKLFVRSTGLFSGVTPLADPPRGAESPAHAAEFPSSSRFGVLRQPLGAGERPTRRKRALVWGRFPGVLRFGDVFRVSVTSRSVRRTSCRRIGE